MAQVKRRKFTDIPISIDGDEKYVTGVSQNTTCVDVIKMVLRKTQIRKENSAPDAFGIYESSRGIERLLPAKSRILKVIRSWNNDDKYELVFRKVNITFVAPKMSHSKRRKIVGRPLFVKCNDTVEQNRLNDYHDSDRLCSWRKCCCGTTCSGNKLCQDVNISRNVTGKSDCFGYKMHCSVSLNEKVNHVKYAVKKTLKSKHCEIYKSCDRVRTMYGNSTYTIQETPKSKVAKETRRAINRHENLARDIEGKVARMYNREGKEALLQKYFADYIAYRSPENKYHDSRYRERGDGAENDLDTRPLRRGDGIERDLFDGHNLTAESSNYCSNLEGYFSPGNENSLNLDRAFIDTDCNLYNPPLSPVKRQASHPITSNKTQAIQNSLQTGKLVDYSLSDDSLLTDLSNISSVSSSGDNVVHNVTSVSDIVKTIFAENEDLDEDDEMESFMKTIVYNDLSDEGLSSLGSGDEQEIIV